MKNRVFVGTGAIIGGLLVSLGPQFIFKLCPPTADGRFMRCHWTGQAEIGMGLLIVLLGLGLVLFPSYEIRLGLSISVILACIVALLFPSVLIGGCEAETMACRVVTFPALTVICILGIVGFVTNALYLCSGWQRKGRRPY
ncbi:MAG: DUF4418 family protein [Syntrophomonadaceae bacterium]|nr:DUF4418 family protein [Syntrophomonadaceae bacterium]